MELWNQHCTATAFCFRAHKIRLAFHLSILHSVLATKIGQAPAESYTKHMNIPRIKVTTPKGYRVTGVKTSSSDAILSWSKKTALFGVSPLISQPSLSG